MKKGVAEIPGKSNFHYVFISPVAKVEERLSNENMSPALVARFDLDRAPEPVCRLSRYLSHPFSPALVLPWPLFLSTHRHVLDCQRGTFLSPFQFRPILSTRCVCVRPTKDPVALLALFNLDLFYSITVLRCVICVCLVPMWARSPGPGLGECRRQLNLGKGK